MNKTLNKIKSNNIIIKKEKNHNNTIDNFKKSEKIKKFTHINNDKFTESIEVKKEKKLFYF